MDFALTKPFKSLSITNLENCLFQNLPTVSFEEAKSFAKKAGKRLIPIASIGVGVWGFGSNAEAKGIEGAAIDEGLDNVPVLNLVKAAHETFGGTNWVMTKEERAIHDQGSAIFLEILQAQDERWRYSSFLQKYYIYYAPLPVRAPTTGPLAKDGIMVQPLTQ